MKLTAKQLRRIIKEEAERLGEIFTPVGGIGFGEIPRRPRSDWHDLTLAPEGEEINETDGADETDTVLVTDTSVEDRLQRIEEVILSLQKQLNLTLGE